MIIEVTGKELHEMLESLIPNFEDADLYHDTKTYKIRWDEKEIERQAQDGYISIDDEHGHQWYYAELEK